MRMEYSKFAQITVRPRESVRADHARVARRRLDSALQQTRRGSSGKPHQVQKFALLFWVPVFLYSTPELGLSQEERRACRAPNAITEIPIEKDGGPILVQIRVEFSAGGGPNGSRMSEKYAMLLDTGAERSAFDVSHRASLGDPVSKFETRGPDGPRTIDAFMSPVMYIGDTRLQSFGNVACIDLKWLSFGIGEQVDGILGMDNLRSLVFSIDFNQGVLRFQDAVTEESGRRVPLIWKGAPGAERPFVRATLDEDRQADFLVDTACIASMAGTFETMALKQLCDEHVLAPVGGAHCAARTVSTPTGRTATTFARARLFGLSGSSHAGLIFAAHPRINSIGLGYLSRYRAHFDFPNSALYLRPSKSFQREDVCHDYTSFLVWRADKAIRVTSVPRPEVAMDIRVGDLLISVNGRRTDEMTVFSIRRTLALEPHQELDFMRDGVVVHSLLDFRNTEHAEKESGKVDKPGGM